MKAIDKQIIKVNNLKSAKRLMSRLISEFQAGTIKSQYAKDLTYLVSQFLAIIKNYEFEQRIERIEDKINSKDTY